MYELGLVVISHFGIYSHYSREFRGEAMFKETIKKGIRPDYWRYMSWYRAHFGFFPAITAFSKLYFNNGIGEANTPSHDDLICFRPGSSDQEVFHQVFFSKEYAVELGTPNFIVDAGAHIGISSLFFASRYPHAQILAIEPESENFKLLCRNTRRYGNISPLQAGLWSKKGWLRINNETDEPWSFRVSEVEKESGIAAINMEFIFEEYNTPKIDILKIDIEGAEIEVFCDRPKWLQNVTNLIIELHDRFQPGCKETLESALTDFTYTFSTSGENRIYSNLQYKKKN